jgi:hypothetical protein
VAISRNDVEAPLGVLQSIDVADTQTELSHAVNPNLIIPLPDSNPLKRVPAITNV